MMSQIRLTHTEREVKIKDNARYGIPAKYLKTVHYALMRRGRRRVAWSCPVAMAGVEDAVIPRRYAYIVHDDRKTNLYAWMRPEEYELLANNKEALNKWMSSVELNTDLVEGRVGSTADPCEDEFVVFEDDVAKVSMRSDGAFAIN